MTNIPDEASATSERPRGGASAGGKLPGEQSRKSNWVVRVIKWAGASAIVGIVGLIPAFFPRVPTVIPQYQLLPRSSIILPRNGHQKISLSVYNQATKEAIDVKTFRCTVGPTPAGIFVRQVKDQVCEFEVASLGTPASALNWPKTANFDIIVNNPSFVPLITLPVTIEQHDVERPRIGKDSFRWENGNLVASTNIGETKESNAKVELCLWQPEEIFLQEDKSECRAIFKKPLPEDSSTKISVTVRFRFNGDKLFDSTSDEVVIHIPPQSGPGSDDVRPSPYPSTDEPPRPVVGKNPVPLDGPRIIPPSDTRGVVTTTLFKRTASVSALISYLDGYRDDARYDRLVSGIKGLPATVRLGPSEALDLLGPLTGNLAFIALSNYVLPRLRTPASSKDVAALLKGFTSEQQANMLLMLAGCFQPPVDKDALLSGIVGSDRDWVEPKLDSGESCSALQAKRE